MKEKALESRSDGEKSPKKSILNPSLRALAVVLVVSAGVIGVSPRVALADQSAENTPVFLCTDPNNSGQEIYVFGGRQAATYRQLGAVCKPL